jgi:pyruvate dehydrogenase (quinone)
MEGDPKFVASQTLPNFPYAAYADLLGLNGIRIDRPDEIGPAWDRALSAKVPTVLEVIADPDVPPLPPHISAKETKAYMSALMHGDPDSIGIIKASAKQMWDSWFPGDGKG